MFSIIVAVLFVIKIYSNSVHSLQDINIRGRDLVEKWMFETETDLKSWRILPKIFLNFSKAYKLDITNWNFLNIYAFSLIILVFLSTNVR